MLLGVSPQTLAYKFQLGPVNSQKEPLYHDNNLDIDLSDKSSTISYPQKTTAEELADLDLFSPSNQISIGFPEIISSSKEKSTSRYQENFDELELLGRGSSGEVVKVR